MGRRAGRKPKRTSAANATEDAARRPATALRIIGGRFRGRSLAYNGDPQTRPMKDRTREAVFNLLGPRVKDKHAIDLFAGTGALGLEAISRGAARATLIERHFPTARIIRQNIQSLGADQLCQVVTADAFFWARQQADADDGLGQMPCVVFCSPPYRFYEELLDEMLTLITRLIHAAAADSIFVVEADVRLDVARLPEADAWDVRQYSPAQIAIYVCNRH